MAETSITEALLQSALTERLKATHVEITDTSGMYGAAVARRRVPTANEAAGGCGQSFTALVVSPEFAGKNALKRHRLVNAALRDEIARIHAWSARCLAPDEWERDRAAAGEAAGPPLDGTVAGRVVGVKD